MVVSTCPKNGKCASSSKRPSGKYKHSNWHVKLPVISQWIHNGLPQLFYVWGYPSSATTRWSSTSQPEGLFIGIWEVLLLHSTKLLKLLAVSSPHLTEHSYGKSPLSLGKPSINGAIFVGVIGMINPLFSVPYGNPSTRDFPIKIMKAIIIIRDFQLPCLITAGQVNQYQLGFIVGYTRIRDDLKGPLNGWFLGWVLGWWFIPFIFNTPKKPWWIWGI